MSHLLVDSYLGYNQISVVEGLEECFALEELHLEHQFLPPGVELTFDPRVITALSQRLRLLNVAGCNLSSLSEISGLLALEKLNASDNSIEDLRELCSVLQNMINVRVLDMRDNDVTRIPKYRDKVIAATSMLRMLDGREINNITRNFIQKFEAKRSLIELSASRASQNIAAAATVQELGKDLPAGLRRSVTNKFLREAEKLPILKTLYIPASEVSDGTNSAYHFPAFRSSTSLLSSARDDANNVHRRSFARKANTAMAPIQHHSENALSAMRSTAAASAPLQRTILGESLEGVGGGEGDIEPDPALLDHLEVSLRLVNNVLSLSEIGMNLRGAKMLKESNLFQK